MNISASTLRVAIVIIATVSLAGCSAAKGPGTDQWPEADKIKFRLDNIGPDGLRGPPDGLVAVAYEFCVPASELKYQEVRKIDPSLQINPHARGRIGCASGQALAIGETHQPDWRQVLQALSALAYVDEIRECFFE